MKRLIIAAVLAAAPLAAHAEDFTFATYFKTIPAIALPPASAGARREGHQRFAAATMMTFADGRQQTTHAICSSRVAPLGSPFGTSGVCAYTDAGALLYTMTFFCEKPGQGGAGVNCRAELAGEGGSWAGRTGVIGFANEPDGSSHGAGRWN